ncbi:LysR family transcriptional regulator [Arthrobacter sp. UYCu723]
MTRQSNMNLRRLQYFLAVVDARTVTGAAESLHIAQPALGRQIKTLERELRLRLFEAQGNRLALTAAGRALVPMARRLMRETHGFEEAATALRTGYVQELVAATTSGSLRIFLAPFIATMGPDDPRIIPREINHFDMTESLRNGCDFAISPAPPDPVLRNIQLGRVPVRAYVSAGHEWALNGVAELPISSFAGVTAVLPSHHSASRHIIDEAVSRADMAFQGVTECDDGQTIVALAAAGRGVGFSTERPLYGAHAIIVREAGASDGNSNPLALPLHLTCTPGHFAEGVIAQIADRIRDFLALQGMVMAA